MVTEAEPGRDAVDPPARASSTGREAAFPDALITVVTDDDPAAAALAAHGADVVIIIAGFTAAEEGEFITPDTSARPELLALYPPRPPRPHNDERLGAIARSARHTSGSGAPEGGRGGDRSSLRLRPVDEEIIHAVAGSNPRTVVALVTAGAVLTEAWRHEVPATLVMWYPGMEGGHALADVLTGRHNPSGRLPYAIPTSRTICRTSTGMPHRSPTTGTTASGCSTAKGSRRHIPTASGSRSRGSRSTQRSSKRPRPPCGCASHCATPVVVMVDTSCRPTGSGRPGTTQERIC